VYLLSGDINLSIRGESDGGLVVGYDQRLILIVGVANPGGFSQIFRRWSQERTGRAELSPAVSLVLTGVVDLTDTFSPRYVKAGLQLIFSRLLVRSWSIG